MQVLRSLQEALKNVSKSCVTIGNFDGVHMGHQKLLCRTRQKAALSGLSSVAVTFEPHPLRVLVGAHTPPFITLPHQKLEAIATLGMDFTFCVEFTKELAKLEPEEFVCTYLVQGLGMRNMVIGYDYAFGRNRKGDYVMLCELGERYGFDVEQIGPVLIDDAVVSSSRIRDMVQSGLVWEVRPLLGRFYRVQGKVVTGRNRGGKLLGFPTANLRLLDELFPKTGAYAVWAEYLGRTYPAVANIGYNPTFGNDVLSVEAHILDFEENIYDKEVCIHFVQRLRSEQKFENLEALISRIQEDILLARRILGSPEAHLVEARHCV
ncbi:riboflavin kinase / FMN adenylyltransferase [Desulfonatronum thiosulfatophilum]|uniref:Riboflavin biosynthesis protein n=1 Tax=Desulfonatronum thiosulfatophilum TaxID=617002 RepID=A0A1G6B8V7_9BACT|nr:bifunctional riboflavin kinase/FAD synthetase [Desulfonatronum thiosulfatophilum]SDB17009.1 riboflavin kinase / FMN adenylyltransferase [Desulfonatronum thiosulfatophilum]